jgi:RNA polymerase sigma-70 factor, ECF subfamily
MNDQERRNLFSELIARHQSEIYGYIFAVVRNWEDADDLFQAVCLVLWSKFESFRPGSSFFAWARQTAKFKVRKFLTQKRKPTYLSEQLLDTLVESSSVTETGGVQLALAALDRCKEKLDATDEELLELRYALGLSTVDISQRLQRLQPNVSRSLNRIRRRLLDCIKAELAAQKHPGRDLS